MRLDYIVNLRTIANGSYVQRIVHRCRKVIGNTTMATVKVRTNGNNVDLIDSASLSQGSVSGKPHSGPGGSDDYSEDHH